MIIWILEIDIACAQLVRAPTERRFRKKTPAKTRRKGGRVSNLFLHQSEIIQPSLWSNSFIFIYRIVDIWNNLDNTLKKP